MPTPPTILRCVLCWGIIAMAHGQDATVAEPTNLAAPELSLDLSATPAALQATQLTLAASLTALLSSGATPAQLQTWTQQNAAALAARQELALDLSANAALQPQATVVTPNIPLNASPSLKNFLTSQAALVGAHAQIHNQLLAALPSGEITDAQIAQLQQSELLSFQQQQGAGVQQQVEQGLALADAALAARTLPSPLAIPPGTNPDQAALLTAQDQFARDQAAFVQQYATADRATREAALMQWLQQNADRCAQIHLLSQKLSTSTSTSPVSEQQ